MSNLKFENLDEITKGLETHRYNKLIAVLNATTSRPLVRAAKVGIFIFQ
jgi:hypothetical protein